MTTPAHVVVNLVLLGRGAGAAGAAAVVLGAVAPDVPIVALWGWERLVRGMPEAWIWSEGYGRPGWQLVIDLVHSVPLAVAGAIVARWLRRPALALLCASLALHSVADLLLHNDDAHRHLLPISPWRFHSQVSYWDPAHFGNVVAPLEAVVVLTGCALLAWRTGSRWLRGILTGVATAYLVYLGYAVVVWM